MNTDILTELNELDVRLGNWTQKTLEGRVIYSIILAITFVLAMVILAIPLLAAWTYLKIKQGKT